MGWLAGGRWLASVAQSDVVVSAVVAVKFAQSLSLLLSSRLTVGCLAGWLAGKHSPSSHDNYSGGGDDDDDGIHVTQHRARA